MKKGAAPSRELPSLEQLSAELSRERYKRRYRRVLRSTVYTLVVVAATADDDKELFVVKVFIHLKNM